MKRLSFPLTVLASLSLTTIAIAAPVKQNDGLGRPNQPTKTIFPSQAGVTRAVPTATCPKGYVALTYDDGPMGMGTAQNETMGSLVAALTAKGLHATFFDIGSHEEEYPAVAQKALAAGMDFGDHTYWHVYNAATDWTTDHLLKDISDTSLMHQYLGGQPEKWFRPPYDQWMPKGAIPSGMTQMTWTLDDHVYDGRTAAQIANVYGLARNGDIVLSHVGYQEEIDAVPAIAAKLKANGLCAGRLIPSSRPTINAWAESFNVTVGAW